jgi:hypothetical protein
MNPVETPYGASDTAGMVSTPEELKELWIAADRYLDPARIVSILSDGIAKCLDNLAPDERRAVERTLAVQRLTAERAEAMERSLAVGERMLAIKESLAACKRIGEANPDNDPERIQEMWRQDRLWCHRMGIDFDKNELLDRWSQALNYLLNRSRGNTENSSYLKLFQMVLRGIIFLLSTLTSRRSTTSKILTNFHDDSSGHLLIASCHVTRGPDAAIASFLLVAA